VVKLGREFDTLAQYVMRVGRNPPDILNLDHLTVAGDVVFGRDVTLRGSVIIVAKNGAKIAIPDGAVLEDKVLAGDLMISDLSSQFYRPPPGMT
jgi:UTP--glucose-1-phosphate uridylyltransferase